MSGYKKFADFCSGFAAFMAFMHLLRRFLPYTPSVEDESTVGTLEKLKMFLDKRVEYDKRLMFTLLCMLILSVIVGRALARFPQISIIATVPPILLVLDMIETEYISEYPLLYLLLCCVAFSGAIYECIRLDKRDGKRRSAVAGNATALLAVGYCLYIYKRAQIVPTLERMKINRFDSHILNYTEKMEMKMFIWFAVAFGVMMLISILLSDIYFIHAIVAIAPMVVSIYWWNTEKLLINPEVLVGFTVVHFAVRLIPATCDIAVRRQPIFFKKKRIRPHKIGG